LAQTGLDSARQVNLELVATMQSFVADEILKGYEGRLGSSKRRQVDAVETEITVNGTVITRRNWSRNGKPWKPDSGFIPNAGFDAELKPLLSPIARLGWSCGTRISTREPGTGLPIQFSTGCVLRILVDDRSGRLIQLEAEAGGFPKGFYFAQGTKLRPEAT
jgi:hypothetical protein